MDSRGCGLDIGLGDGCLGVIIEVLWVWVWCKRGIFGEIRKENEEEKEHQKDRVGLWKGN